MTSKVKPLAEIIADEVMDTIERERRINRDDLIAAVERRLPTSSLKVDRKTSDDLLSDMVCYGSAVAIVEKDEKGARAKHVGLDRYYGPIRKTCDEMRAQAYARFHQNLIAQDREAKERAAAWKRVRDADKPAVMLASDAAVQAFVDEARMALDDPARYLSEYAEAPSLSDDERRAIAEQVSLLNGHRMPR